MYSGLFVPATAGHEDASVQAKIDAMRHVVNLPMVLAAQQATSWWRRLLVSKLYKPLHAHSGFSQVHAPVTFVVHLFMLACSGLAAVEQWHTLFQAAAGAPAYIPVLAATACTAAALVTAWSLSLVWPSIKHHNISYDVKNVYSWVQDLRNMNPELDELERNLDPKADAAAVAALQQLRVDLDIALARGQAAVDDAVQLSNLLAK